MWTEHTPTTHGLLFGRAVKHYYWPVWISESSRFKSKSVLCVVCEKLIGWYHTRNESVTQYALRSEWSSAIPFYQGLDQSTSECTICPNTRQTCSQSLSFFRVFTTFALKEAELKRFVVDIYVNVVYDKCQSINSCQSAWMGNLLSNLQF